MDSIISTLKKSPLFNLFLSSKELFHSNFLYWVAKNYPKEFGDQFIEYLVDSKKTNEILLDEGSIKREENNIDFSFKYNDNQEIIIENKFKSIPIYSQLSNYSYTPSQGKHYILLSLTEPSFSLPTPWVYLSYLKLIEKLDNISAIISGNLEKYDKPEWETKNYHLQILKDYSAFIRSILRIVEKMSINENSKYNFYASNSHLEPLRTIRLHDFYLKRMHESLSYMIHEALKINYEKILIELGKDIDWGAEMPKIFVSSGMTRGSGLTDIKYIVKKNLVIGIIYMFRKRSKAINKVLNRNFWFDLNADFPNHKFTLVKIL